MELILTFGLVSVILGTASGAQNIGVIGALGVGGYIALGRAVGQPDLGCVDEPGAHLRPRSRRRGLHVLLGVRRRATRRCRRRRRYRVRPPRPRRRPRRIRRRPGRTCSPKPPIPTRPEGRRERSQRERGNDMPVDRSNAMDHMVVVLFENRSLDNVLGHLYGPEDGKTFEGVIGKDLSNPIPEWAEDGADRKVVPYTVATDMDSPNPDSGEEYPHTNTQLYNILNEHNRFKLGDDIDRAVQRSGAGSDTDDGRLRHRLHQLLHRRDGPPADLRGVRADHDRVHPRAGPGAERAGPRVRGVRPLVLRGPVPDVPQPVVLDRGHVVGASCGTRPRRSSSRTTTPRRSSTGSTTTARRGRSTSPSRMRVLRHRLIHFPRLKDRFATHFVPFAQFETDAAERGAARLLVHRAEHDHRPQRLPPRLRSVLRATAWPSRRRPAVVDPGRRSVPVTDLQRLPGDAVRRRAPTCGTRRCSSAGTSRAAPTTTSRRRRCRPPDPASLARRARLHVRPLRLPSPGHHRVAVGRRRRGVQRGVPPHVAHRHPARAVGPG